jgi:hypothetical protein
MSKNFLVSALAVVLTVSIVAPSAFFIASQNALAQVVTIEAAGPLLTAATKGTLETTFGVIQETITAIAAPVSAAANVAMQVNAYVLQPLAFVLSGKLMKLLTAGVIGFVIGKANGTGVPQFVADVMKSYQTVADSAELAYLKQINNTNSPFASSIRSALNKDYLSKTSLAGFWAQNICTLQATSPNVPAYLAGNWSQGGVAAWFALTTQVQNNPYTLYSRTEKQLAAVVGEGAGGVTGTRSKQLDWGSGFMSWCGSSESNYPAGNNPDEVSTPACPAGSNYIVADGKCEYEDGSTAVSVTASGAVAINPGDPCTKSDGTPGSIQTPGSTIKATLDKVLGGQQDQIVRMGNVGGQITSILGDIATIMNTVNFAAELLGGSGANNGLINAGNTSSSGGSRLAGLSDTTNYLGVTNSQIYKDAAALPSSGGDMTSRVAQYRSAWSTIGAAASTASTSVASLIAFCTTAASTTPDIAVASAAQARAGQVALETEIAPVFALASLATTNANAAMAMVQRVQTELNAGAESAGSTYTTDMQTLQTMPPTAQDLASALQNSRSSGTAVATPPGSLIVASTSSSIVDQMGLISANAQALKSVCMPAEASSGF